MYVVAPKTSVTFHLIFAFFATQLAAVLSLCGFCTSSSDVKCLSVSKSHNVPFMLLRKTPQLGSFKTFTTVPHALVAPSRLSPSTLHPSAETFPTMPCLVAEKHEHHVLLSVLVDLSQPRLVMRTKRSGRESRLCLGGRRRTLNPKRRSIKTTETFRG